MARTNTTNQPKIHPAAEQIAKLFERPEKFRDWLTQQDPNRLAGSKLPEGHGIAYASFRLGTEFIQEGAAVSRQGQLLYDGRVFWKEQDYPSLYLPDWFRTVLFGLPPKLFETVQKVSKYVQPVNATIEAINQEAESKGT